MSFEVTSLLTLPPYRCCTTQAIRLLHECGLPKSDLEFLNGDGPVMQALLTQAEPRMPQFTGSSRVAEVKYYYYYYYYYHYYYYYCLNAKAHFKCSEKMIVHAQNYHTAATGSGSMMVYRLPQMVIFF